MLIRVVILLAALYALGGSGSGCNVPPPPTSETCELAPGGPRPFVRVVEIGQMENGGFVPLVPDSVVETTVGGQGSDMFVVALRITGNGLTGCIAQSTQLETAAGEVISSEEAPIVAMQTATDVRVTGDILLPYYDGPGEQVRLRAEVSGATAEVVFWASYHEVDASEPDARSDAPDDAPVDAVVDAPDDAPPDA